MAVLLHRRDEGTLKPLVNTQLVTASIHPFTPYTMQRTETLDFEPLTKSAHAAKNLINKAITLWKKITDFFFFSFRSVGAAEGVEGWAGRSWTVQGHGGQGARERAEGATPRPAGVLEAPPYPRLGAATSTTRPGWLVSPTSCLRPLQRVP